MSEAPASERSVFIRASAAAWLAYPSVLVLTPPRVTPGRFDHLVRSASSLKVRFTAASSVVDSVPRKVSAAQTTFAVSVVALVQSAVVVPASVVDVVPESAVVVVPASGFEEVVSSQPTAATRSKAPMHLCMLQC